MGHCGMLRKSWTIAKLTVLSIFVLLVAVVRAASSSGPIVTTKSPEQP